MLNPGLLDGRGVGHIGIGRIVGDKRPVGRADAVACVGVVGVFSRLGAILGNGKTPERGPVCPQLGDVGLHRNRHHRRRAGRLRIANKRIAPLTRHRTRISDTFVIIVIGPIIGINLPIVPACFIAAETHHRRFEIRQLSGIGSYAVVDATDPVNQRVDGMDIRLYIDGYRRRGIHRVSASLAG